MGLDYSTWVKYQTCTKQTSKVKKHKSSSPHPFPLGSTLDSRHLEETRTICYPLSLESNLTGHSAGARKYHIAASRRSESNFLDPKNKWAASKTEFNEKHLTSKSSALISYLLLQDLNCQGYIPVLWTSSAGILSLWYCTLIISWLQRFGCLHWDSARGKLVLGH